MSELSVANVVQQLGDERSERDRDIVANQQERELKSVEKQAEERGKERAINEADHAEFRRHLAAINGSVARVDTHMAALDAHMTSAQSGVNDLVKDVTSIVKSLDARETEARADRKSVILALYSFATAIVASGVGALMFHFL